MKISDETILHIDLNKLERNYNYLKSLIKSNTQIIGVVKAFAYGHGDIEIAKKLEKIGVYALWVSDIEEAIKLRKAEIDGKIIVANPGYQSYDEIIKYNLDVIVYNQKLLLLYCTKKSPINLHLKFNTGMNRYGFDEKEINIIAKKIIENKQLNLLSICSHLASSENINKKKFTISQIEKFEKINCDFKKLYNKEFNSHILNSNGVLNYPEYQFNMVRLGIGLYGSANNKNLKQISKLTSIIVQIRRIKKGEYIGYGSCFIAQRKMQIAIVPVGYADGLNRKFSDNNGVVIVKKLKCKILGAISMDSLTIDISNLDINEGDKVEIFGENLSVLEIANKINTIPYEVYSTLNKRIKRVYLN